MSPVGIYILVHIIICMRSIEILPLPKLRGFYWTSLTLINQSAIESDIIPC